MGNPATLRPKPWKKGESGNPAGKAKGTKNRSTLLRKWLDAKVKTVNPATEKEVTATVEDDMILSLIKQARKGNVKAQALILDSVYGKIVDKSEMEMKGNISTTVIIQGVPGTDGPNANT